MMRGVIRWGARGLLVCLVGVSLACAPSPSPTPPPSAPAPPSPTPQASAVAAPNWSVVPLAGASEAFAGSTLGSIVSSPSAVLAVGHDDATGLPVGWTSGDGVGWRDLTLAPTAFGGGTPTQVVSGPGGWLAIG